MRDLINALKAIEESALPINRNVSLNESNSFRLKVVGAPVLLNRIDELACNSLLITSGSQQGERDPYNTGLMLDAGFEVVMHGSVNDHTFSGEIITSKGSVRFG